jgi:hypothetical protein
MFVLSAKRILFEESFERRMSFSKSKGFSYLVLKSILKSSGEAQKKLAASHAHDSHGH